MTQEHEEVFKNNNICPFYGKSIYSQEVRDLCHLTGNYRGPAQHKCNINVAQKHFSPFVFHKFSYYYCHLVFKKLIDEKKVKVLLDVTPKTNQEHILVTYGCIRPIILIDSYPAA